MSRSKIQQLIDEENILVNNQSTKSNYKVQAQDQIQISLPEPEPIDIIPEDIPLEIIYEDEDVVVIKDRKSTRLNSSHVAISYAVFCLKKKTPSILRIHGERDERRDVCVRENAVDRWRVGTASWECGADRAVDGDRQRLGRGLGCILHR